MPNRTPAEQDALHTVAANILANAAREYPQWEDFPEIGESDWFAVCDILNAKAPEVPPLRFRAAYALLEARAKGQEA
jgi:hypothetical protein